jgi:hypothetical protein
MPERDDKLDDLGRRQWVKADEMRSTEVLRDELRDEIG